MWRFSHTETTSASVTRLWRLYARPATWPSWDHELKEVCLDGPFRTGSTGTLTPATGPKTPFVFENVTEEVEFTDLTRLPLAVMRFRHRLAPDPDGCRFTHSVEITGTSAGMFGFVIGRRICRELPRAMRALARLAERPEPA